MFDFIRKSRIWDIWDRNLDSEIEPTSSFELKTMQDLAVYAELRGADGLRIAEIGAGKSRVLPTLARSNSCVTVERFDGSGGGVETGPTLDGVDHVSALLGENDPALVDGSFDIVFSISVMEHVASEDLERFHVDQLRILKPGGVFVHAIDLYLEGGLEPAPGARFEAYRSWVTETESILPLGEVYEGPCRFTCDLVTNPDNVMYSWSQIAPEMTGMRQRAQVVSVLVGGKKTIQGP